MVFTISKGREKETLAIKDRKIQNTIYTPKERALECFRLVENRIKFGNKLIHCLDAFCGKGILGMQATKVWNIVKLDLEERDSADNLEDPENFDCFELNLYYSTIFENFNILRKYDLIVSNPPFTPIDTFTKYFWKMLSLLNKNGYLICFCPVYFLNNSDKRQRKIYKYISQIYFLDKNFFGRPQHNALIIASNKEVEISKRFSVLEEE